MGNRNTEWMGTASDLLCTASSLSGGDVVSRSAGWPKTPRALAGRVRRAQTFLRTLGIDVAFSRESYAGARVIRIRATPGLTDTSGPSAASATMECGEGGNVSLKRGLLTMLTHWIGTCGA
jgi:hypothetical protein